MPKARSGPTPTSTLGANKDPRICNGPADADAPCPHGADAGWVVTHKDGCRSYACDKCASGYLFRGALVDWFAEVQRRVENERAQAMLTEDG